MALKGKKKSQTRGSQGRRRPAAAPRPVVTSRARAPWYRTSGGRVGIAVGIVALIGVVAGGIVAAGSNPELERKQERLEDYTAQLRAMSGNLRNAAEGMKAAPVGVTSGLGGLKKDATRWIGAFASAQGRVAELQPPASIESTKQLFTQSVQLYSTAAETFDLATRAPQELQAEILARAGALRDQASSLWVVATNQVDAERTDADLEISGLLPPAQPGSVPAPAPPAGGGGKKQEDGGKAGDDRRPKRDRGGGAGKDD